MFTENPRGFMVFKKISEIMVFETSTAKFIPVWVAQDCRLRSFKYCLWHEFFWSTLPCKLCRMRRSFKPICPVHNFVNHGQLIWMLQMGALSQFLQHQEKPTVHRGDFLPKLGKEAILLIFRPTHTYCAPPLNLKVSLTCIKICDLDDKFTCISHVRQ